MKTKNRWGVATAALGVLCAGLVSVSTPADAAPVRRGPSYHAKSNPVGAHMIAGQRVYRLTPGKRAPKNARLVGTMADTPARARAAWILSTYGTTGTKVQAAAVDVAVLSLLKPRRFGMKTKATKKRIKRTGTSQRYVRSYARQMLTASTNQAGPYTASLTSSSGTAAVGSGTTLSLTVRDRSGAGVSGIPVTISYGPTTATSYTGPDGVASTVVTTRPGTAAATATATRLPATRVSVWAKPKKRKKFSRLVVAGRTGTATAATRVLGTSTQQVTATIGRSTLLVGQPFAGSYTVTGGTGTRTASRRLVGGYATTAFNCSIAGTGTTYATVSAGTFAFPAPVATQSGYYRWAVTVGSNPSTPEVVSACSAPMKVQRRAAIQQIRNQGGDNQVKLGGSTDVNTEISGFDRSETHQVVSRAYGPFTSKAAANCGAAKLWRTVSRSVSGNGYYDGANVTPKDSSFVGKWFIWQSTLSSADLILGATSTCGIPFKVVA